MRVTIDADTSFYTDIVATNAVGAQTFNGCLKLEPDWWVLYDTRKDYMGTVVKRWRGSRNHLPVLAAALVIIDKLITEI